MNKSLLIVTHRNGFECDPVIDRLRERDIPFFRFNADDGEKISLINVRMDKGDISFEMGCDGRSIRSSDIAAGWYQQPPPFVGQPTDETQCLQRENILAGHDGMLGLLAVPWLNPPDSVRTSGNKILQLAAAAKAGLQIPATVIANDPTGIKVFCGRVEAIVKNLATPWIDSKEGLLAAYTKTVEPDWLEDTEGLRFCPVIYQERSARVREFRVVMIGGECFAASCVPNAEQQVDIRHGLVEDQAYEPCEFPREQIRCLRALMDRFGTDYCSADFMEDAEGNVYFLDLNTCGAWWWVDKLFDGKICEAITRHLMKLCGR